jgi:hypothetical protein
MEQNETIDEVNETASDTIAVEESHPKESEATVSGDNSDQNFEQVIPQSTESPNVESSREESTESINNGREDELYMKLKTGIMDEIRKYFDPVLQANRSLKEVREQQEPVPLEKEDSLINRIIDETGW